MADLPEFVSPDRAAEWLAFSEEERARITQIVDAIVAPPEVKSAIRWHPLPPQQISHLAIEKLIQGWESEYVRFLRVLRQCRNDNADYWRWNGHAARLRDCLNELHKALDREPPNYLGSEWRDENGVS
jgi:hypothetical protein